MPKSSTRKNSEAPGATNRINPNRAAMIPSTRTSPKAGLHRLCQRNYSSSTSRLPTLSRPHYGHGAFIAASISPKSASSHPYSPNSVEGEFSEVQMHHSAYTAPQSL